ncbi:MAG: type IX secretion system outer membrane channel protein PorV [Bacteroidota bacterium]|nr:type IX secretion system outer membrane channel protein PorV [Ferruginibacter sp.]
MKISTLKLAALIILGTSGTIVKAQSQANSINVVTSAVPFLRISPDARSGGMGDVGIATAPDANSAFWNLAKTPFNTTQGGVVLTYTPWLKDLGLNDVYLASLSAYYKLDDLQAISTSLRYFNLGNIQFTDNLGNDLSSFRPREFAFDLGYSRKLSDNLGLGVALRYINSNLASGTINGVSYKAGSAVAGDLSIFHTGVKEDGSGLNYGVTLSNLGSKISYTSDATQKDYIPANLGLGIAYNKVFDETSKITFGMDINKLLVPTPPAIGDSSGLVDYRNKGVVGSWFSSFGDAPGGFSEEMKEFQLSLGTEFWYMNQFALRAGYFYENPSKGNRQYFTLGAGLKYSTFGLNFSYLLPSGNGVNRNPLSNTLRFSLVFDFGEGAATTPAAK